MHRGRVRIHKEPLFVTDSADEDEESEEDPDSDTVLPRPLSQPRAFRNAETIFVGSLLHSTAPNNPLRSEPQLGQN